MICYLSIWIILPRVFLILVVAKLQNFQLYLLKTVFPLILFIMKGKFLLTLNIFFIENYTRYSWVCLIKRRSLNLSIFQFFWALVKSQHFVAMKCFLCDLGGEYTSSTFSDLFLLLMALYVKHLIHILPYKMEWLKESIDIYSWNWSFSFIICLHS